MATRFTMKTPTSEQIPLSQIRTKLTTNNQNELKIEVEHVQISIISNQFTSTTKPENGKEKNQELILTTTESTDLQLSDLSNQEHHFTPEEQAQLSRIYKKLDLRILPALWIILFLITICGSGISNAYIMNTEKGNNIIQTLHLNTHQIRLSSTLSTVGSILFDVPVNILMTYLTTHIWLARIFLTDGLIYICYAAANSGNVLVALRFLTGAAGAGVWPGMFFYISLFYPAKRLATRCGIYFTGARVSIAISGLISAGVQKMDGVADLQGWRWFYLISASLVIVGSLLLPVVLPDNNLNRKSSKYKVINMWRSWNKYPLTADEIILHQRDMAQYHHQKSKWTFKVFLRVIANIRLWPLVFMNFGILACGTGILLSIGTIIKTLLKINSINTSLLFAPLFLFDSVGILLISPLIDRYIRFRPLILAACALCMIIGLLIMTFCNGKWAKYGGMIISCFFLGVNYPNMMAITTDIYAPIEGDIGVAISTAVVYSMGNLGGVFSTYALYHGWPSDSKRLFRGSNLVLVLVLFITILFSLICHFMNRRYDKRNLIEKESDEYVSTEKFSN